MREWPIARVIILLVMALFVLSWMAPVEERAAVEIIWGQERIQPVTLAAVQPVEKAETEDKGHALSHKEEAVPLAVLELESGAATAGGSNEGGTVQEEHSQLEPEELYRRLASGELYVVSEEEESRLGTEIITPEEPTVYLTFDDGPSQLTPKVLDILREHEVQATFFILGQSAEAHADTIRRMVDEGHAIGNHTWNHRYEELYTSFEGFWEQVVRTDELLHQLTAQHVRLFRAPGGTYTNFDAFYFYYMGQAGYQVHDWTVDAGDSRRKGVPAEEIVRNIKQARLTHEVNVLLHDSAGHEATVQALPEIIHYYKEQGYRFAVLSEQVRPVTFRLGKLKWEREWSEAAHDTALERIRQADPLWYQTFVAQTEATAAGLAVASESKQVQNKHEWLPLRDWAYAQGAIVYWDARAKTARMTIGSERLELRTTSGTLVWEAAGQQRGQIKLVFALEEDRLYVKRQDVERWRALREAQAITYHSPGITK